MSDVMNRTMKRRLCVVVNDPVHDILRVAVGSDRLSWGSRETGIRLCESDDHVSPAMVRQCK